MIGKPTLARLVSSLNRIQSWNKPEFNLGITYAVETLAA